MREDDGSRGTATLVTRSSSRDAIGMEIVTRSASGSMLPPFGTTEDFHPNQIGQQALQACIRQATVGGTARSGRCEAPLDWAQVDPTGLPLVRFTPE
jgi:hypothetical protein